MRRSRRILNALDRAAIPNITAYWIGFQVLCMFLIWGKPDFAEKLVIDTAKVLQGEWWRLITFIFMPVSTSPLFAAFVLYFYWLMGTVLEANWGAGRYNLFLLIGLLMNIGAAFLPLLDGRPGFGSNTYLVESIFLAFAALYPDYVISLFLILPIRVKWLALLTWLLLAFQFLMGDWTARAMVAASIANFLLFFWRDILERIRFGSKQMQRQVRRYSSVTDTPYALHKCVVCGATERSHPQLEFRYCSACGGKCYCLPHLANHPCTKPA